MTATQYRRTYTCACGHRETVTTLGHPPSSAMLTAYRRELCAGEAGGIAHHGGTSTSDELPIGCIVELGGVRFEHFVPADGPNGCDGCYAQSQPEACFLLPDCKGGAWREVAT
jgi:hypothetical protein